jgi:ribose transport system permease protein
LDTSTTQLTNCLFVTHVGSSAGSFVLWAGAAVGAAALVGAVNGFLIAIVRLQPLVVTLATMFITQGITLLVMKQPGGTVPQAFSTALAGDAFGGNVPMPLVVIGTGLVVWFVLRKTRLGTAIYAVGSDESAAHLKALPTRAVKFWLYVFADMGDPYLLTSIAVVVVGGTLMTGGRGNYAGMLGGALLLTALGTLLSSSMLPSAARSVVYGVVVLIAVVTMREKRRV